jgi:hypothetical protein
VWIFASLDLHEIHFYRCIIDSSSKLTNAMRNVGYCIILSSNGYHILSSVFLCSIQMNQTSFIILQLLGMMCHMIIMRTSDYVDAEKTGHFSHRHGPWRS